MQEVPNEVETTYFRRTVGGRELEYRLKIVQGPQRARACGNGPRSHQDRRPVDPPPVVRLQIYHNGRDVTGVYEASFLLYAGMEHARPYARGSLAATNHCPVLTGMSVAGAAYLARPVNAAYFIFPDLSVRHEGHFRLKFHLFEQPKRKEDEDVNHTMREFGEGLEHAPAPNDSESMNSVTFVYSTPFQVFSAKKFPGLESSTDLSKLIADQGCRVRIRRDIRQRRSGAKDIKKDDERPSLRAASHDRGVSTELNEHWNRPAPIDTRRPSVDSSASYGYNSSRHPSHSQAVMSSPGSAGPASHYARPSQYNAPTMGVPLGAGPEEMYNSMQRPSQTLPPIRAHQQIPPPMHQSLAPAAPRLSYPPPSPTQHLPSYTLPSVSSLLNTNQPQRPAQPYSTTPVLSKRGYHQSREEGGVALKDGARPTLTPKSQQAPSFYNPFASGSCNKTSMVIGSQVIEADDDGEEIDFDEESDDRDDMILSNFSSYKRADGQMQQVHRHL